MNWGHAGRRCVSTVAAWTQERFLLMLQKSQSWKEDGILRTYPHDSALKRIACKASGYKAWLTITKAECSSAILGCTQAQTQVSKPVRWTFWCTAWASAPSPPNKKFSNQMNVIQMKSDSSFVNKETTLRHLYKLWTTGHSCNATIERHRHWLTANRGFRQTWRQM